jgi:hypothetical protein
MVTRNNSGFIGHKVPILNAAILVPGPDLEYGCLHSEHGWIQIPRRLFQKPAGTLVHIVRVVVCAWRQV